jgi:aryl-alcohol dehydrogenase-like predicted oxidoreductase
MHSRILGASGIEAGVVGFGAWAVGGWAWGGVEEREAIAAIHAAIEAGSNLVDTAPMYGYGRSEEIVGKAIRDRRDRVVIATKCGLVWNTDQGVFHFTADENSPRQDGAIRVHKYLGPKSIRAEVETSLRRLGTDRIDLLQTHWQENTTPVAETMGELMRLRHEGKIRAIGCSNATPAQMDAYRQAGQLDTDQEKFSMLDRAHESANLPYCARHGIAFLAYSPLAQGLLTGTVGPDRQFPPTDMRAQRKRFSVANRQAVADLLAACRPVAERHGLTLGQLAIAWAAHQPGCSHVLAGARTPPQAVENARAGDARLTPDDLAAIRNAITLHAADIPA